MRCPPREAGQERRALISSSRRSSERRHVVGQTRARRLVPWYGVLLGAALPLSLALGSVGCTVAPHAKAAAHPARMTGNGAGGSADATGAEPLVAAPSSDATPRSVATTPALKLPLIAWDGGPSYYAKFPAATAYGWTSPNFFPIAIWAAVIGRPKDVRLDKAAGVNTYVWPYIYDYRPIQSAHMSVIADVSHVSDKRRAVVGYIFADEPDGKFGLGSGAIHTNPLGCATSVPCGFTVMHYLDGLVPKNTTRFTYTNYTGEIITNPAQGRRFLNDYQTVSSMDDYYFTGGGDGCYVARVYHFVTRGECPKAADYGMDVAHERALDPHRPIWNFVELGTTNVANLAIKPGQIGGAVWDSLINGAMGIDYFIEDTSRSPCGEQLGNVLEDKSCPQAVAATREVTKIDRQIKGLAPILNTQSFKYRFNRRLDTMLKYYNGSYYIFAIPGLAGKPGTYTLTLPQGLNASTVQVLFEKRTISVEDGKFSDAFNAEYTYHIYKITP